MGQLRRRVDPNGQDSFFNNTGATISAKRFVKKTTTANGMALVAASTDAILGVAVNDVPDQTYGLIQMRGLAIVKADGTGVTAGSRVMSSDGTATTWTAGAGTNANVGGLANTTAAAASDLEVELAGPGVIEQG